MRIARNLDRPDFGSERQAIGKSTGNDVLKQVSSLLQVYAPTLNQKPFVVVLINHWSPKHTLGLRF
jgi:hypothetical protein